MFLFFFIVVLSHRKVRPSFSWQGRKVLTYSKHLWPKSPRKIIIRVLEKYFSLVAITATSPKAVVAASKLVPRIEKIRS